MMILGNTTKVYSATVLPVASPASQVCDLLLPGATSTVNGTAAVESDLHLSTVVTPDVGGVWQIAFDATYANGNLFHDVIRLPATRLDIRALTFEKLDIAVGSLPQSTFDTILSTLIDYWLEQISSAFASYSAMSAAYQIQFDLAMVSASCGFIVGYKDFAAQAPTGELAAVTTGTDTLEFRPKYAPIKDSDAFRDNLAEVWRILSVIPGVAALLTGLAYPVFVASGPRNALRKKLGRTDVFNPRYPLDYDELMDYMLNGGYLNGLAL